MGESRSVGLLIGTTIYFFLFFTLVFSSVNATELDNSETGDAFQQSDMKFDDPGFMTDTPETLENDATVGWSGVSTSFSVMSGVGSGSVEIGEPSAWSWLFNFVFFWIPLALFFLGLYFALPAIH